MSWFGSSRSSAGSRSRARPKERKPEMSATEAQLGLASELEFRFDLKFDGSSSNLEFRIQVSNSSFWSIVSGFEFQVSFSDPFSVPLGIYSETHFRSLLGSLLGPSKGAHNGSART